MNKLLQAAGGRKFLLTLLVIGVALGLELTIGLSTTIGVFLGAALTAFCAANLIVTSRHMTTDVSKSKNGTPGTQISTKLDKLIAVLETAGQDDYYKDELSRINEALVQIAQAQANTLVTVKGTSETLSKALAPKVQS